MFTIQQLLSFMKQHDADDLYLSAGRPPSYKISGAVKPAGKNSLTEEDVEGLADSIMDEKQKKEFAEIKEMNLALFYPDIGRFRANIYRQKGCSALVIRKIETEILTLDDLKLPEVMKDIVMTKRGLVLVVGATGSGKSTTLAAMVDHRNRTEEGHILTIEDPVEFVHEHKKCVISQREVGADTDSFKNALKNALRQAPTVILIGEIRDEETMEHALNFAETGHLCLATLHSNNANQAMERIINFFPSERHAQVYNMLSLNLQAVVSQRLIKTVDGRRAAAIEILRGSGRAKDLIKRGEIDSLKEAMEDGGVAGMQTFDQALLQLYQDGRISLEQCIQNADSPTDMKIKIKLGSMGESGEEDEKEPETLFSLEADEDQPEEASTEEVH